MMFWMAYGSAWGGLVPQRVSAAAGVAITPRIEFDATRRPLFLKHELALNSIGVAILSYPGSFRGYPQNRHFQYQRHPLPVAGPARMVRARRAGCGLLAGIEGPRRGISDQ